MRHAYRRLAPGLFALLCLSCAPAPAAPPSELELARKEDGGPKPPKAPQAGAGASGDLAIRDGEVEDPTEPESVQISE